MKNLNFGLKRNQIFDLIRMLKSAVKDYDDLEKPGRYVLIPFLINSEVKVNIALDRGKDPYHPLFKKYATKLEIAEAQEKGQIK